MTSRPVARPPIAPPIYEFPKTADGLLPWSHADQRLRAAEIYWLATVCPDGRPHVAPLWGVWLDGVLYFDGLPTTRWGRNILADPRVSVNLESGDDVVIFDGVVEDIEQATPELGQQIVDAWTAKYGSQIVPEPVERGIFSVRPRRARAWSGSLVDGTVWTFDQ